VIATRIDEARVDAALSLHKISEDVARPAVSVCIVQSST
jgi:hypothetical protein